MFEQSILHQLLLSANWNNDFEFSSNASVFGELHGVHTAINTSCNRIRLKLQNVWSAKIAEFRLVTFE